MDTELLLGMLVLGTAAVLVLAPLFLLQVKGKQYRGEKARFRVTGKLLNKCFGSIGLPTHSFSVFSSGLMLSSMFNRRFIPAPEIQSVAKNRFGLTSCIEVKLQSGELLRLSTGRDGKLIAYLNSLPS